MFPRRKMKRGQAEMAKSQKRSNREIRKPKAGKAKPPLSPAYQSISPVQAAMQKPKGKL
jgi:hypothetical protein